MNVVPKFIRSISLLAENQLILTYTRIQVTARTVLDAVRYDLKKGRRGGDQLDASKDSSNYAFLADAFVPPLSNIP